MGIQTGGGMLLLSRETRLESILAIEAPHIASCEILLETPADLLPAPLLTYHNDLSPIESYGYLLRQQRHRPTQAHLHLPGRHDPLGNFRRIHYFTGRVQAGRDRSQSLPGFPSDGRGKAVVARGGEASGGIAAVIKKEVESMPKHWTNIVAKHWTNFEDLNPPFHEKRNSLHVEHTPASSRVKHEPSSSKLIQESSDLSLPPTLMLRIRPATSPHSHIPSTTLSISRTALVHHYNEQGCTEAGIHQWEYVYRMRSLKVARMYPNRVHTLGKIKAIRPTGRRPEAKVDLHNISRESAYRTRFEKPFSKSAVGSSKFH
ncbi:hypothetical protein B9Z19DRAFT_1136787 [Tuber borchii]|uniref:Uncharacterized protein n=1 Tax=Tuber borchii TaxID=42251 RepID=A0A2T6ZBA2_TUBBO|nr:hypothetical protein B9Z19DRAFT_1136787 [Tuber borchii]